MAKTALLDLLSLFSTASPFDCLSVAVSVPMPPPLSNRSFVTGAADTVNCLCLSLHHYLYLYFSLGLVLPV